MDYLHRYITTRNTSSISPSSSQDVQDYDYHSYYYNDQSIFQLEDQTDNDSDDTKRQSGAPTLKDGRPSGSVYAVEGTMGYGWGQAVSIILDKPAPGRWFAAVGMLEGDPETERVALKVTINITEEEYIKLKGHMLLETINPSFA